MQALTQYYSIMHAGKNECDTYYVSPVHCRQYQLFAQGQDLLLAHRVYGAPVRVSWTAS
jgi:hypothetical protein